MLRSLYIENFAIIDKLQVEFGPGLNIVTGETGAGKTIIVHALNLVLGDRLSSDWVRSGADLASISAIFSLSAKENVIKDALSKIGVDEGEELIIRRTFSTPKNSTDKSKGKITINGVLVTQQMLRDVAEHLVDVSSQHEHQLLLDPMSHCWVIDKFGELEPLRNEYDVIFQKFTGTGDEVLHLKQTEKELKDRLDFIKYQLQELKEANLKIQEDGELESERLKLKHAVQLKSKAGEVEEMLYSAAGSVVEVLGRASQLLSSCAQVDQTASKWKQSVEAAEAELSDTAVELKKYVEKLGADPLRLETVDERLHLIRSLTTKHGGSIESCLDKLKTLELEMCKVEGYDDLLEQKNKELNEITAALKKAALNLSSKRRKTAKDFSAKVENEVCELGMKNCKFTVDFHELPQPEWSSQGKDKIEFFIAPNAGEDPRPLAKIASGGELSRFMLGIKRVLADKGCFARTSVFDEVDSGIGGATAEVVGRKLLEVARRRQVICITHLPQIASFGDHHFAVTKEISKGRTLARIEPLDGQARREELARMLGGSKITKTTRAHAEEMLNNGRSKL